MIRQIISVTWKDLKILFTDIGGVAVLFLMPLMFIVVMSTATQGMYDTGPSDNPRRLPVANLDRGQLAAQVVAQLAALDGIVVESSWEEETLTRARAEALVSEGDRALALVFPADFSERVEARLHDPEATATIELITDPAASTQFIAPIQAMVYGVAERVAETALAPARIEAALSSALAAVPGAEQLPLGDITFETEATSVVALSQVAPADMDVEVFPDAYQQTIPGYTVFGVFFIVSAMASSILREKHDGTFRRLLAAPLPKPALLAGKLVPYYLVNLIQVAVMFAVGVLLFGMQLGDPVALVAISMALAAAATGLGILVATFGKTETQIDGLATLLTLAMSALGGCLIPSFVMPEFMQSLARFVPHYWAMQGFQDVLVRGYGIAGILPEVGALLGFAAIFFLVGVWRFRFD
ncbi:MAG: ABC-2 transporter permease [Anaerolineales bacterium]|nr:MAG: ABC-2 transporter permease [Anaerolineales bacterium]